MLKSIAGFRKLAVVYPSELSPLGLLPGARKLFATFCDVRVGKTLHLLRLLLVNGEVLCSVLTIRVCLTVVLCISPHLWLEPRVGERCSALVCATRTAHQLRAGAAQHAVDSHCAGHVFRSD